MTKGKRPSAADDDREKAHTFVFVTPASATRAPSADPTTTGQEDDGIGDQLILLLLTRGSTGSQAIRGSSCAQSANAAGILAGHAVVQLTSKRNLVLVPRDLPQYLRGLWCTGRTCDYLVYARGRSVRHLIAEIQQLLASGSTGRV
ncbi:MAG: hypothetical protein ACLQUY_00680 [Ktedonobacterales bacterium]